MRKEVSYRDSTPFQDGCNKLRALYQLKPSVRVATFLYYDIMISFYIIQKERKLNIFLKFYVARREAKEGWGGGL